MICRIGIEEGVEVDVVRMGRRVRIGNKGWNKGWNKGVY